MSWFKIWHGLPYEAKFGVIARKTNLKRAEVIGLWLTLADFAYQNTPQGSIQGFDEEEVAVSLDLETSAISAALDAFRARHMITEDNMLAHRNDKNPNKNTLRVRAHRARKQQVAPPITSNVRKRAEPEKTAASLHPDDPAVIDERRRRMHQQVMNRHTPRPASASAGE